MMHILRIILLLLLNLPHVLHAQFVKADIIPRLNELTYTIADQHDHFYSLKGIRTLTIVHLAAHDIIQAQMDTYQPYLVDTAIADLDVSVAIHAMADQILTNAYPLRQDTIESVIGSWMSSDSSDEISLDFGMFIADQYLNHRNGDGHEKQGEYTPMSKPGDYQYTEGWDEWVFKPDFTVARPFSFDEITTFRVPPPPSLESARYARDYDEIVEYGGRLSAKRTSDQTHFAHWWAEFAEHSWNRIARIVCEKDVESPDRQARLFALINMDIYDIYLASLESKYYYDTWRPVTAIHQAKNDGNEETLADPAWQPEMLTPPWPEYPSAHAAVAGGGAEIVSETLGRSNVTIEMSSVTAPLEQPNRKIEDLRLAAEECAASRIMNGYHFRFSTDEGLRQGRQIANHIIQNFLQPVDKVNK